MILEKTPKASNLLLRQATWQGFRRVEHFQEEEFFVEVKYPLQPCFVSLTFLSEGTEPSASLTAWTEPHSSSDLPLILKPCGKPLLCLPRTQTSKAYALFFTSSSSRGENHINTKINLKNTTKFSRKFQHFLRQYKIYHKPPLCYNVFN